VIHIVGVEGGQAGPRELGVEAGGLMAGAFVARPEKMGQLPGLGHILAIGLADGNWRPT
jgi:hypothetical protein